MMFNPCPYVDSNNDMDPEGKINKDFSDSGSAELVLSVHFYSNTNICTFVGDSCNGQDEIY